MKKKKNPAMGLGASESEKSAWGKGEYANMPQEVSKQLYRKAPMRSGDNLDDTINEIDECVSRSDSKARRYLSDQH